MKNLIIPKQIGVRSEKTLVNWPFANKESEHPKTEFWFESYEHGFILEIEAQLHAPLIYIQRPTKGRVFETDCLELFLRPTKSSNSKDLAPLYYGWEIAPNGCLLEYRAGIGEEGRRIIGSGTGYGPFDGEGARAQSESISGLLYAPICDELISFNYDWKSQAGVESVIDEPASLWRLRLQVPWADFGLDKRPSGEAWTYTVNRIDVSSSKPSYSVSNQALACMHSCIKEPAFHQPKLFIPFFIE